MAPLCGASAKSALRALKSEEAVTVLDRAPSSIRIGRIDELGRDTDACDAIW